MLVIQDPTNEQGTYLLESLAEAFESATTIRGIFAFASASGVDLLFDDESFQRVAREGVIDIVIGTDAVTNAAALDACERLTQQLSDVSLRAFLNPRPEGLFHPKFCFAKNGGSGRLVAGSGNLTEGGLLGNWEAYAVDQLDNDGVTVTEATWQGWVDKYADCLLPLNDPRVRERVAQNNVMAREGDLPTLRVPRPTPDPAEAARPIQVIPDTATVLIAEIPRSGDRWKQANFDLDNYRNFFGAREDAANRLVIFRHVNADGTMAAYERNRPPVAVKSQNYRFELAAASGREYPAAGRPIAVFIRMVGRTFFYRLLMPENADYELVDGILERLAGPNQRPDRMRRERLTVRQLREEWPNAPFWNLPATF